MKKFSCLVRLRILGNTTTKPKAPADIFVESPDRTLSQEFESFIIKG